MMAIPNHAIMPGRFCKQGVCNECLTEAIWVNSPGQVTCVRCTAQLATHVATNTQPLTVNDLQRLRLYRMAGRGTPSLFGAL